MNKTPTQCSPHLEIRDLYKTYISSSGSLKALENTNLVIEQGEFVSIVGPSGCGKSTLLKIIFGVTPPTGGSIRIDGKEHTDARKIGMVFQTPALLPWRNIKRNVLLPIDALNLGRTKYLKRTEELLEMVGLTDFAASLPQELSGGMQQRVSLCRALIHDPELLLMDEPFGALDALTRESLQFELLRIWRKTGKTVLFVTHSIDEAVFLSNRVLLMSGRPGRFIEDLNIELGERDISGQELRDLPTFREYAQKLRSRLGAS